MLTPSCKPHCNRSMPRNACVSTLVASVCGARSARRRVSNGGSISTEPVTHPGRFVDTHCHLDKIFPGLSRQAQRDAKKAVSAGEQPKQVQDVVFPNWRRGLEGPEAGFEACVNIGCEADRLDASASFLKYDGVYGAFGIHPLRSRDWNDEVEQKIVRLMSRDKVVAWGECGLDYFDKSTKATLQDPLERDLQKRVFASQLDLAVSLDKPLVIHTRWAEEDTILLLKRHLPRSHLVHVHCFTSSLDMALELLEHFPRLHIGFTGVITFGDAYSIRDVVRAVPLDRILLETDGPFMAPEPHRGRVSHPGHVFHVAKRIAEVKDLPVDEVLEICRENTRRVYGI